MCARPACAPWSVSEKGPMESAAFATDHGTWRDLDFKIVEIVSKEPVDPLPEELEANPLAKRLEVDGKRGQTVGWRDDLGKHLVETFDGDVTAIAEECLREFEQSAPELTIPRSEHRAEFFPAELAFLLEEWHYCVLQATSLPEERRSASRAVVEREERWTRIVPDAEAAYMGKASGGKKIMWLDHLDQSDDDPFAENGLAVADRKLSELGRWLGPVCPNLGFQASHRTNAFVQARCSNPKEEEELLEPFGEATFRIPAEEMQGHLSFTHRRKLCMMYFVHGSGGTLTLHPVFRGAEDITLPCRENTIVVFRHDLCDYTYFPEGKQLCVQAWILREPHAGEVGISSADTTDRYNEDIDKIPDGPVYGASPETVDCMSLGCRYACNTYQPEDYWAMLAFACDGGILIPHTRWDHDLYYEANPDALSGKAYARHFGMLDLQALTLFNNTFFGISDTDASCIDPPARVLLEAGYDCLFRAGWTSRKLRGVTMGMCFGTAESEFAGMSNQGWLAGFKEQTRRELLPAMTSARLQFTFGIRGPCQSAETACSSALSATCVMHHWMRPKMPEHRLARTMSQQVPYGLAGGCNAAFNAGTMIGFCGAHMLSIQGRCFTFDQSGDGFLRAEGIGAMHYKTSYSEDHARLSMLVASQMNQDGRSASLTAPHGPSQQECIRYCLREAGITPLDVQVQELHGTGTALGDPIETGSLRATMMVYEGEVREHPIIKTSSKSNFGHTELNAGMCGIMKCCLLGVFCACTPNCHIRLLNPHVDVNSYPVLFSTEIVDQSKDTAYCGVSSFGWSGCNARGDMYSRCLSGPRNTEPGQRLLDLTAARVFRAASLNRLCAPPEPAANAALDDLRAYDGEYGVGMPADEGNTFYCKGSFSASMEQMSWLYDRNAYAFAFALGETRVEQFQLVVNKAKAFTIFPAAKMADPFAQVLGPGKAPPGHAWAIDGRSQGVPQGTVYMVFFAWDEEARQKRVWWEASEDDRALAMAASVSFRHSYSIVGSWTLWKPVLMRAGAEPGLFETEVRVGFERHEDFRFLRDADPNQAIYPARGLAKESDDMPVRGPDFRGEGKAWFVSGKFGEPVAIQLRVWEGEITVSTTMGSRGVSTWTSDAGPEPAVFYVSASWNEFGFSAMEAVQGKAGVYRLKKLLSHERMELFQIVVDKDRGKVIHPEMQLADQLISPALGPDGQGEGLHWGLYGWGGAFVEITLDLTQVESDRRKVVTWEFDELQQRPRHRREGFDPTPDAPEFPTYDYEPAF
uniref:Type I polyketide synthase n=1 Tax=Gambierdiscus excentricus TaxID=986170 RepID=A0A1S6K834_9DINO|nr:type I polyketide synthase [Gambierdiscus excentricus]